MLNIIEKNIWTFFQIFKNIFFEFYFFQKISEISEIPIIEKNKFFQFFETICSIFYFFVL